MTPTQWERVKDVFEAALERQGGDRTQYVAVACHGDQSLRDEVERLLAGYEQAGSFLEQSPSSPHDSEPAERSGQEDLLIGQNLSHYQIAEKLGEGGMGTVYRAVDLRLRRPVAIKMIKRRLPESDPDRRLVREARAASALNHSHICHIYEIGETDGTHFIVMEYVQGQTLTSAIREGPLQLSRVAQFGAQAADALAEAHAHGIIHRDIKPSNVMIGPRNELKILDFGLAKVNADSEDGTSGSTQPCLTRPGVLLGTVQYMSPEQLLGQDLDHRTDLFSLGLVLYEMATGRRTFPGTTQIETIDRILHAPHEPLVECPELEPIISKCLEKERERRYQSAAEVADDLRKVGQGLKLLAGPARRKSRPFRGRKFLKQTVTAVAFSTVIVLALVTGRIRFAGSSGGPDAGIHSIVVLPFADTSPDKNQGSFADGVTEDVRNMLATIPGLRVSGRTSSNRVKGEDFAVIGKKLNVEVILEGSVRKLDNRVRIAVQLFNSADGVQVWSNSFDRDMNDILTTQEEIARVLARELNITLLDKWKHSYPKSRNATANTAYLTGRYSLRRNKEMLERAVGNFELAISLDSHYAPAWEGLGKARILQSDLAHIPTDEGFPKARSALERALALDPDLPDAQLAMGIIKMSYEWDWTGASAFFQRALAKAPGNTNAVRQAGTLAATLGHFDEAIRLYQRAIQTDPLYANTYTNMGSVLNYAGRQEEARAALTKAIEMEPKMEIAHANLSRVFLTQSHPVEALHEAEKEQHAAMRLFALALANQALGRREESDSSLSELVTKFQSEAPYLIGAVYAFRGEADQAFEWLNRAYAVRDTGLTEIKGDPLLQSLVHDPRYAALLQKLRLPL